MSDRTCSVDGCTNKHKGRGFCATHLMAWRRNSPDAPRCSVDSCSNAAWSRGLCTKHYQRQRVHGDPLVTLVPNRGLGPYGGAVCAIDGCGRPRKGIEWCSLHYTRFHKYGDPLAIMRAEAYDGGATKWCPACKQDVSVDKFYTRHRDGTALASRCHDCKPASWTPEQQRRANLRKCYGISPEEYDALLASQGGGCAICGSTEPAKGKRYMPVDHCHGTGAVRGILCGNCNMAIGLLADDPERLILAAAYLQRTGATNG